MNVCPTCGRPIIANANTWTPEKRAILAELVATLQQLFADAEED